jgi:hypothetical protein
MVNKIAFKERLQGERVAWDAVLAEINESQMVMNTVGDWSVKDVIAHVTSYERYIADRLWEIARGEVYRPCETPEDLAAFLAKFGYPDFGSPLLDDDEPNARVVEHNQEKSLADVQAESTQTFDSLIDAIDAIPNEQFTEPLAERIAGNTWEHYRHHIANLRTWLDQYGQRASL